MKYGQLFFDYVDESAAQSAKTIAEILSPALRPNSVLDVGCGRGGWLRAWKAAGSEEIFGIDGSYVDRTKLAVAPEEFQSVDLAHPFDLGRKFDFVQSLEVGEHLPPSASAGFVESITHHGDVVLFSAALPGQGGTQHINERPIQFWRSLFAQNGYRAYDYLRPAIEGRKEVEPWYRFNTLLYANSAGEARLPPKILATAVPEPARVRNFTTPNWLVRRALVRYLPVRIVDQLAVINAKLRLMQRQTGQP
jgi:SAM-dependent methyltransferase